MLGLGKKIFTHLLHPKPLKVFVVVGTDLTHKDFDALRLPQVCLCLHYSHILHSVLRVKTEQEKLHLCSCDLVIEPTNQIPF